MGYRLFHARRALRRALPAIADSAWILAIVGGILLLFWIIWDPPR